MARRSGLTVKTLQAPFEGARFAPTLFSILAVGLLVMGLPLMTATASNIGANISLEIIDAANGRQSEGDLYTTGVTPTTGYDLVNSPYTLSGPYVPFSNVYSDIGLSPLFEVDVVNAPLGTPATHIITNYDPLTSPVTSCVPNLVEPNVYGGSSITAGLQEIAFNISTGDEVEQNDFRVARSLQIETYKNPANPNPSCTSYDWDYNLLLPDRMFNTTSLITQIRFDIVNDASVHGSVWSGSDYCITSSSSFFNVELMMNGTSIQNQRFENYCGVIKMYNTSFNESDPSGELSYRHTTGGEFIFDLEPKTAFDLRAFMDENNLSNYTMSLKVTNCSFDCPLGFVSSAATPTLTPIWINYYSVTTEPDAYSTIIRGSALIIGLIFLICSVAATPLWNPLAANLKGASF